MTLTPNSACLDFELDEWIFELQERDRQQAWEQSAALPNAQGRWQSYLNHLCQNALQTWLAEEIPALSRLVEDPGLPELVPGSALNLEQTRLVVLPVEALDAEELVVPQEWIDLATWFGDYYVAVQVSAQEDYLHILGYATHRQIKETGTLDTFDRTYHLEIDQLVDWDLFAPTYQHYSAAQTRVSVGAIAPLPPETAQNLIQRLIRPDIILPRLEIPFAQWGAMLEQASIRQQLSQARQGALAFAASAAAAGLTSLTDWLQGQIGSAWQRLDIVRGGSIPLKTATAFRSSAAEPSLLSRGKQLDLAIQETLLLVVGIGESQGHSVSTSASTPASNLVSIVIKLEPLNEAILPHEVQLRLIGADGTEIAQASAATTEELSMEFRADRGEQFAIEVSSQGQQVTEYFSV